MKPKIESADATTIDFELCGYRFKYGPSLRDGAPVFSSLVAGHSVWLRNGYYWGIVIANADGPFDPELASVKGALQYQISEWRKNTAKARI